VTVADEAPRRRALCVGIDDYPPPNALAGCRADAESWSKTLADLNFAVTELLDADATYQAILGALRDMVSNARNGDVLVFQYSGHGTEVPDLDGDETSGTNGDRDEAMVPIDFEQGQFLIDDDLRQAVGGLPDGASLTVFADCCHSGTVMRAFVALDERVPVRSLVSGLGTDIRARYIRLNPELEDAYREARRSREDRGVLEVPTGRPPVTLFSACRDYQVAYEHDGHGDFTSHCMTVLSQGGAGLKNAEFLERVRREFGERSMQDPELDFPDRFGDLPFLQVAGAAGGDATLGGASRDFGSLQEHPLSGAARLLRGLS